MATYGAHFPHEALPNCKAVLLPGGEHFGPLAQSELQFLRAPGTP